MNISNVCKRFFGLTVSFYLSFSLSQSRSFKIIHLSIHSFMSISPFVYTYIIGQAFGEWSPFVSRHVAVDVVVIIVDAVFVVVVAVIDINKMPCERNKGKD